MDCRANPLMDRKVVGASGYLPIYLSVQKWSQHVLFYILTWKCASRDNGVHFWTSQLRRSRQFLTLLTSKCASRRNGVQLFISHLARWLRTRRFGEPTFRPSGATNLRKNAVFRDFPTFSPTCTFSSLIILIFFCLSLLFSSLTFSFRFLTLPISAFYLSILSEV